MSQQCNCPERRMVPNMQQRLDQIETAIAKHDAKLDGNGHPGLMARILTVEDQLKDRREAIVEIFRRLHAVECQSWRQKALIAAIVFTMSALGQIVLAIIPSLL